MAPWALAERYTALRRRFEVGGLQRSSSRGSNGPCPFRPGCEADNCHRQALHRLSVVSCFACDASATGHGACRRRSMIEAPWALAKRLTVLLHLLEEVQAGSSKLSAERDAVKLRAQLVPSEARRTTASVWMCPSFGTSSFAGDASGPDSGALRGGAGGLLHISQGGGSLPRTREGATYRYRRHAVVLPSTLAVEASTASIGRWLW